MKDFGKRGKGKFEKKSRYISPASPAPVKKIFIPKGMHYALIQVGMGWLEIIDIKDPSNPKMVLKHNDRGGYLNEHIALGLLDDQYACAAWHMKGMCWYNMKSNPPSIVDKLFKMRGIRGIGSIDDKLLLFGYNYYYIVSFDDENSNDLTKIPVTDRNIIGKPVIYGKRMYISSRRSGTVTVIDISDESNLEVIKKLKTKGTPGPALEYKKHLLIPDGYEGLRIYDNWGMHLTLVAPRCSVMNGRLS